LKNTKYVEVDPVHLVKPVMGLKDADLRYRRLFETVQEGILILDASTGEIIDINPALEKMLGYSREEFLGKKLWENVAFKDIEAFQTAFRELHEKEYIRYDDLPLETKDGQITDVELIFNAYFVGPQRVIQCNLRAINEQKQAHALLQAVYKIAIAAETTKDLSDLFQHIHQIISSVMPAEFFYITLFDEAQNVLRFPYFKNGMDEPYLDKIEPGLGLTAHVLRTGKSLLCTQPIHDELERQGAVKLLGVPSAIWLGVPLTIEGKTIGAMVVQHYTNPEAYSEREQHILEFVSSQIALAISRKQAEEALRQREQEYQTLVDNSPDAITRLDLEGRFQYVNPAQAELIGLPPQEIIGRNIRDLIKPEDQKTGTLFDQQVMKIIEDPREQFIEFQTLTSQGLRWLQSREVPEFADDGSIESVLVVTRDITERKQMEERLRYLTIHDTLTGLYNRTYFEEELSRLERGREFPASIIMLDTDDLKETNDGLGHAAGDALLKRVAQVLTTAFRAEDVVARIGGDEFAVLLPRTGTKAAEDALCRVKRLLHEHNSALDSNPLQLSFGVSTAEYRGSLSDVLKDADKKMYAEKQVHADLKKRIPKNIPGQRGSIKDSDADSC
jgi:diguanylate cyclase (GGDEF)-like protein/PAS domain S-box-containing protein